MVDMPRLVQEWKQVCFESGKEEGHVVEIANFCVERSRTGLEEVAEWEGEEVECGIRLWIAVRRWCGSKLSSIWQLGCLVYSTCTAWLERHITGVAFPLYHINKYSFVSSSLKRSRLEQFMFNKVNCSL